MKELTIISGKGGTGKTSIVASFASLAKNSILADCDVDAPDLHIILDPAIEVREDFIGGKESRIMRESCTGCGECMEVCRFDAIKSVPMDDSGGFRYEIDPFSCEACGVCAYICPERAIEYLDKVNGELFVSETRHGPMVHAGLHIAEENSGKLVTHVRQRAREIGESRKMDMLIVDGSPGIGCPVIASITGVTMVLIVTEPTLSAQHDLDRVVKLCNFFHITSMVCINKYDLNREIATDIEHWCEKADVPLVGRIPYDPDVTAAQVNRLSIVEYSDGVAATAVRIMWNKVSSGLNGSSDIKEYKETEVRSKETG
jgi:MinD superfamily P-loop ATPase